MRLRTWLLANLLVLLFLAILMSPVSKLRMTAFKPPPGARYQDPWIVQLYDEYHMIAIWESNNPWHIWWSNIPRSVWIEKGFKPKY